MNQTGSEQRLWPIPQKFNKFQLDCANYANKRETTVTNNYADWHLNRENTRPSLAKALCDYTEPNCRKLRMNIYPKSKPHLALEMG